MAAPDPGFTNTVSFGTTFTNIVIVFTDVVTAAYNVVINAARVIRDAFFGVEKFLHEALRAPHRIFPIHATRPLPMLIPAAAHFQLAPSMVGGGIMLRRWR